MSWLKRLKALFGGAQNDVIEDVSEEGASSKIEVTEGPSDVDSTTSDEKIAEEKSKSSVADVSQTPTNDKSDEELEEESNISEVEATVEVESIQIEDDSTDSEVEETVEVESNQVEDGSIDLEVEETVEVDLKEDEEEESDNSEKDVKIAVKENKEVSEDKKGDKMTLLEDNDVIRRDSVDKEFTQLFVDEGIESLKNCFQCGTCSGGCPSGRRTPYRVRQIVRKCLMGLKEEVISDPALWMCTTCYTCQERCPREIKIVEIIKKARNIAAENGYMSSNHKATGANVIKTGHGVPINDATKALRKRVGLSEIPPTTHADAQALKDIQTICKATNFDKLIDFEG